MSVKAVIQSYVIRDNEAFFVSTTERESSALTAPGFRYNEIRVWEWNFEKRERGGLLYQESTVTGSIRKHQDIVNQLYNTGTYKAEEED